MTHESGVDSREDNYTFLVITFGPGQELAHFPTQWVPVAVSLGLKQHWREAYHSPPFNAEVKNDEAITLSPTSSHAVALN